MTQQAAKTAVADAMAQSVGRTTTQPAPSTTNASGPQRAAAPPTLAGMKQGQIGDLLASMKDRIAMALPKHLTPERIIQMAATTISKNPAIAECSTGSLMGSVMQASILGFPPVDALGYCYFVPYFNKKHDPATGREFKVKEVQFQIGYKGFIDLARRSGKIKMVYAEVVREGDEFTHCLGLYPDLQHKPSGNTSRPITHAYAVCHLIDGGFNFVVLSRDEVERLRMRSPGQGATPSGAWASDYEAMAKAKALKQLSKYLPLSIDQAEAVSTDSAIIKLEDFGKDGQLNTAAIDHDYTDYEEYPLEEAQGEAAPAATPEATAPAHKAAEGEVQTVDPTTGEIFPPQD
ncbi:MAG: recombinase RecT [Porphyromonadaceae bacterium]|nr:recombinase RecT [Porphyromonadaceae bacterium]